MKDQWLQVSIRTTHEATEAVADLLREAGARNGVEIEDPLLLEQLRKSATWELCDIPPQTDVEVVTVTAYYPKNEMLSARLDRIEEGLKAIEGRIGPFRFGPTLFREVSEKDWANQWKQYFHTTKIGKHIVIKPSWETYTPQDGEKIIALDPGMAFGTGTHATTSMCIERLQELVTPQSDVFDVGTGSGILAMTAALMGARSVHAVDIDEKAVEIARENIARNFFDRCLCFWFWIGYRDKLLAVFSPCFQLLNNFFEHFRSFLCCGGGRCGHFLEIVHCKIQNSAEIN